LSLVELRIAEGKATKKVLERVQKLYDERFKKELVTA
jgi:NADH:ubiquinone oxidoreductase subunit B-like Fe-S oxidoreductase